MEPNAKTAAFSLPANIPLRRHRNSILTANILVSYLERYDILSKPDKSSAKFKWAIPVLEEDQDDGHDFSDLSDPSVLYVCRESMAEELLGEFPASFFVVITRRTVVPDWARRNKNRIVLVRSNQGAVHISADIKNFFASMLVWEDELDGIVARKERISSLLTEASIMLGSFICLTDSSFSLMGASEKIEPPNSVFAGLLENGCYSAERIARIEKTMAQSPDENGFVVDRSPIFDGLTVLNYAINFDGIFFAMLTIATDRNLGLEPLEDLFLLVAHRTTRLMESYWDEKLKVNSPWYQVFTKMIRGEHMTAEYVDVQLSQTEIPEAKLFKLICLDMSIETKQSVRNKVTAIAHSINTGKNYTFAYNGTLFVLCYLTSENNVNFSSRNMERELTERIYEPYGIRAGISRIFGHIFDLNFAYQQTQLALNFADVTDAEQEFAGLEPKGACYFFDYALPYYLLADSCKSNMLSAFSLQRNVVQSIVADDKKNGSKIAQLLWMYLCNDRSATTIAKLMHVHRNTVLYHIDKVEKSYDIKVDDLLDRNKLVADFRLFFLTEGFEHGIDYDKLLSIESVDDGGQYF